MCGRFGFVGEGEIGSYYNLPIDLVIRDSYNIAPSNKVPVVVMKDKLDIEYMQWGFVPFWAKDEKIGFKMINARSEDIENKPSFKRCLVNKRCLIPASFFYEWQKQGKDKQPYLFKLKDRDIFSFAGLYDDWKTPVGENKRTFTIITTEANDVVGQIHDRMPVILKKEDELKWVSPILHDVDMIKEMLKPYPDKEMTSFPVSKEVNSSRENSKELIKEIPINSK